MHCVMDDRPLIGCDVALFSGAQSYRLQGTAMRDLPAETVTFLFTDIEGSTRLWDAHPAAMQVALARHDAMMRQIAAAHHGEVFKTIGDAFCIAFNSPADAVGAALAAQQALQAEVWQEPITIRVRMALHTGAVERRDNDYFGPPLNRVARLLGLAAGEQVILSQTVQELCSDCLPHDAYLISLGEHQLRDLKRPEQVFQLVHPEIRAEFPPLKSINAPPITNLPQHLTSFIGREQEISDITSLLKSVRLLTVTGNGGSGKTRLALKVASELIEDYAEGVWLIELEGVRDPGAVASAIAMGLKIAAQGEGNLRRQLIDYLRGRQMLLVMDNFEQVVEAASLIQELLISCPKMSFLITSRERLRISGEQEYPLDPFPVPALDSKDQDWGRYASVQLFVERCRAVNPDFALTTANGPVLGDLCRRLDGIPLAIELAAARARAMSPQQILQRLSRRLDLLTSTMRDLPQRQRTLRGAIDWSYELLTEDERAIFAELAVFSGGFSLEAAEEVCLTWGAFDAVISLHEKSLLRTEESPEGKRFFMLETMRDYALEKLDRNGSRPELRQRHAEYYLRHAEELGRKLAGAEAVAAMEGFRVEMSNLRDGMDWALQEGRDSEVMSYGKALFAFLRHRGLYEECEQRLAAAFEAAQRRQDRVSEARLLNQRGLIAWDQARLEQAQAHFTASYAISEAAGDKVRMLVTGTNLGNIAWSRGNVPAALQQWQTCLELAIATGQPRVEGTVRTSLGLAYSYLNRFAEAEREFGLARAIQMREENTEGLAYLLQHSCEPLRRQRKYTEAIQRLQESRALFASLDSAAGIAGVEAEIGHNLLLRGEDAEAEQCLRQCLQLATEINHLNHQALALQYLGRLYEARNELVQARSYLNRAFDLGARSEERMRLAEILNDYSNVLWRQGELRHAFRLLCIAAREFTAMGLPDPEGLADRRQQWRKRLPDAEDVEAEAALVPIMEALQELALPVGLVDSRQN
jgi:predicted ATPase/class 3 adenylate cyclase